MNKRVEMKMNTKKLTLVVALTVMPLLYVNAQGVVQVGDGLYVPNYDNQTLISRGCEPTNWQKLVTDYVNKRNVDKMVAKAQTDQMVKGAPSAPGTAGSGLGACFQSAASSINGVIDTANKALSIFNGGVDFGSLASNIGNQLASAACKQVDYVVGQQVGAVTNGINGAVGQVTGTVNGLGVNTPLGNVNAGNTIGGAVTPSTNTSNNIPYVNTNGINNATSGATSTVTNAVNSGASSVGGFFSNINPFRRTVDEIVK